MTTSHRIVVALDLSEFAEIVLEHALDQAARHTAPDLHFVTVAESEVDADVEAVRERLAALVLPALDTIGRTDWKAKLHVLAGEPAEAITNFAAEIRAHLLVIGRFGTHQPRERIGASASKVIDLATCSTLVIGLSGDAVDAQQCLACAEMRTATDGRTWFCAAHTAPDRMRLSSLVETVNSL
ncbi:MAG: universal stress protein [Proteobacteria bacterium]|nr:universal stress protein [Pseudomonadota bacterium]